MTRYLKFRKDFKLSLIEASHAMGYSDAQYSNVERRKASPSKRFKRAFKKLRKKYLRKATFKREETVLRIPREELENLSDGGDLYIKVEAV